MNVELLTRTMHAISTGRVLWDQTAWPTCFAGNALRLSGYDLDSDHKDADVFVNPDGPLGTRVSIRQEARSLLGLTEWQALELFASTNTLDQLEDLVSQFIGDAVANEVADALENLVS